MLHCSTLPPLRLGTQSSKKPPTARGARSASEPRPPVAEAVNHSPCGWVAAVGSQWPVSPAQFLYPGVQASLPPM
ncbi:unnamed protein product [Urochloa humidicola]